MSAARTALTLSCYEQDWQQWRAWCAAHDVDPLLCSTSELTDCLREWHAAGLSFSTLGRRKAAIGHYQWQAGIEHPAAYDHSLRAAMSELRRSSPPQRGKLPISRRDMQLLLAECAADPNTLMGLRDRAIFMVGWACSLNRSNIARLQVADLSSKRRLPDLSLAARNAALEWVKAAGLVNGQLFRSLPLGGNVGRSLATDSIAKIVKRRCAAIGKAVALFSSSSVRKGRVVHEVKRGNGVREVIRIARVRNIGHAGPYMRHEPSAKAGGSPL